VKYLLVHSLTKEMIVTCHLHLILSNYEMLEHYDFQSFAVERSKAS